MTWECWDVNFANQRPTNVKFWKNWAFFKFVSRTWPNLRMIKKLTSAISCLLSTTSNGTESRICLKRWLASWNLPWVVSWYAPWSRWTRSFSFSPTAGTPALAPASRLAKKFPEIRAFPVYWFSVLLLFTLLKCFLLYLSFCWSCSYDWL